MYFWIFLEWADLSMEQNTVNEVKRYESRASSSFSMCEIGKVIAESREHME